MTGIVSLFDGSVSEWNDIKARLAFWCHFYYNISQMDDPPSNKVIENDIALDRWTEERRFANRQAKIKQNSANTGSDDPRGMDKTSGGRSNKMVFHVNG